MRRKNKSTRPLAKALKVFFVAFLIVFGLGFAKGVLADSIPDKAPQVAFTTLTAIFHKMLLKR